MAHLPLRNQLLIATILIILALTGAILLIVRHTVSTEIQKQVQEGTQESVRAFESVQRQRELQLSRNAEMLAKLPVLQSLMTTDPYQVRMEALYSIQSIKSHAPWYIDSLNSCAKDENAEVKSLCRKLQKGGSKRSP